jgi:hypothetical protein
LRDREGAASKPRGSLMGDPKRLRSDPRSPGGVLLRSAPQLEPPPTAQGEIWRRLQAMPPIAATSAAHAAAASKIAAKTAWVGLLKWGAVVALGAPVVAFATYSAMHSNGAAPPAPVTQPIVSPSHAPETPLPPPAAEPEAMGVGSREAPPEHASRTGAIPASALRAEAAMLGVARGRLSAGDYRATLDDVAKLAARFPHGALVQEREVVAIGALAGMGDREALSVRAAAFLERYPEGPYAAHVRHLVQR